MLGKLFSSKDKVPLPWKNLDRISELEEIENLSKERAVLLFKHSTRCSISAMALGRFERSYKEEALFEPYYLDLIAHRDISNEIASRYGVKHESPQAILIRNGKAVFNTSHMGISYEELNTMAQKE
ncbi:bacillithiol system redox-active protein YtxJ [Ekhidna sp.]|uniref:bacillithiol system redox-active protein YtxJ n=1 Tax=Ekhidna sp. TaxID=2608089 RepID=UPI00329A56F2